MPIISTAVVGRVGEMVSSSTMGTTDASCAVGDKGVVAITGVADCRITTAGIGDAGRGDVVIG